MTAAPDPPPSKDWSGLLRLTHWGMAALLCGALLAVVVMRLEPAASQSVRTLHVVAGKLLILVLALRVWLLFFGRGSDRIEALIPSRLHLRAMLFAPLLRIAQGVFRRDPQRLEAMIPGGAQARGIRQIFELFYRLRGITPPKGPHSPWWAPLYLLMFILVFVVLLSGLAWSTGQMFEPATAARLHASSSWVLVGFAFLHVVAVVHQDWRYADAGISGMISGVRAVATTAESAPPPEPEPPVLHLPEADPGTPTIRTRFQNELM